MLTMLISHVGILKRNGNTRKHVQKELFQGTFTLGLFQGTFTLGPEEKGTKVIDHI